MTNVKEPKSAAAQSSIDLSDPQYFLSRELSWLEFNRRVLHEALDERTPLLERLKFLAIFSSNLDEFFMVRVAIVKDQLEAGVTKLTPDGRTPQQQLEEISQNLRPMVELQHRHFEKVLRPALEEHGVFLLNYIDLSQEQRTYLRDYFEKRIFPVLTPLAVDPGHPFPRMSNLSLSLAVVVKDQQTGDEHFARVKVPSSLPRFMALPPELRHQDDKKAVWVGVPVEQVIAHNLEMLFPGMSIQEYSLFRITRDTEVELREEVADDLLVAIQDMVRKRRLAEAAVRLEIQSTASQPVRDMLMDELDLKPYEVYEIDGVINLKDLFALTGLPLPEIKDHPFSPMPPRLLRLTGDVLPANAEREDIFSIIRRQDVLVHHPYESFSGSVEQFIAQAARDPQVLAIKMTLYRTSGDSPIVKSLIEAAENGKQVAALVELKARFDEENNINWAVQLEQSGIHVVYGLVGLKTHTKVVLVVRQEGDEIRRYVHIGTGNYNPKTAKLYTDLGLLSCREELGADLTDLFNYLTGHSRQHSYRKILVSPVNMRDRMTALIRREIEQAKAGKPAKIVAKMNSLVDPGMIKTLYEASQAGVEIDLIIRGMCCLKPGLPGVSDRIRVISIIGRYLEHSRIFHFHNGGDAEYYIGSADWMPRNLDRRVEAVTPIEDPALKKLLKEILDTTLDDNRQAWELQPDGTYVQRHPAADEPVRSSQEAFMQRAIEQSKL
ncbi:MAG: polyphosphate kinase 1 [Cyanobacteria bacterium J069]|nr:MAG: polyphosphate kinase 1 [Cyanobacteria bacterium J069]